MMFGKRKTDVYILISINNDDISRVEVSKFVGVLIDEKLCACQ